MLLSLISMSESAEGGAGATPYVIGGGVLLLLLLALALVLVIGGGREHT